MPPESTLGPPSGAPPFDARFDLKELLLLPEAALRAFCELLKLALPERGPARVDGPAKKLCAEYDIPPTRLARALGVCRVLFREGARTNASLERFGRQLAALVPDEAERLVGLLLPLYRTAFAPLRRELAYAALTDHGQLLSGVSWRVDEVKRSQRGDAIDTRIATITLTYLDGKREKRLTVQALPDMLRALRAMCDAALE